MVDMPYSLLRFLIQVGNGNIFITHSFCRTQRESSLILFTFHCLVSLQRQTSGRTLLQCKLVVKEFVSKL